MIVVSTYIKPGVINAAILFTRSASCPTNTRSFALYESGLLKLGLLFTHGTFVKGLGLVGFPSPK